MRQFAHGIRLGPRWSPSPEEALGADHPLARAFDLIQVLLRQSVATSVVLVVAAVGVVVGVDRARAPLIAAAVVQLALAALLAAAMAIKRERARDLIIEGCDVWLPALEQEQRRLLERRRREALAAALELLVGTAERWHHILPASRPIYNPFVVCQVGPELLTIAARLRSAAVDVRGVARCERLLTTGTSPLFGSKTDELLAELARIRTDLS